MTTPTDQMAALRALCRWHDQHPNHPGPSELAIIALTDIGTERTWNALKQLQHQGIAHPHIDPTNPAIRRWQLTRRPRLP